jgi:hypothetical protein
MRTTLRFLGPLVAALFCAAVLGACGDGDGAQSSPLAADDARDDGGGDGSGGDGSGGGGGGGGDDNGGGGGGGGGSGGGGGGGGGVPGAPIDIPSFQQDQGRPLGDVLADIEETVRDQCGGELCIDIRVEMTGDGFTECTFVATDPPQGSQVERGGTLLVIAGTEPCEDAGTETEGIDEEETDGDGTDEEETDGDGADEEETDGDGADEEETEGSGADDGTGEQAP